MGLQSPQLSILVAQTYQLARQQHPVRVGTAQSLPACCYHLLILVDRNWACSIWESFGKVAHLEALFVSFRFSLLVLYDIHCGSNTTHQFIGIACKE